MNRRVSGVLAWGALALLIGIPGSDVLLHKGGTPEVSDAAFPVAPASEPARTGDAATETAADTDGWQGPEQQVAPEPVAVADETAPADTGSDKPFVVLKSYEPRQVGPQLPYTPVPEAGAVAESAPAEAAPAPQPPVAEVLPGVGAPEVAADPLAAGAIPVTEPQVADVPDEMTDPLPTAPVPLPLPRPSHAAPRTQEVASVPTVVPQATVQPPADVRPDNRVFFQDWVDNGTAAPDVTTFPASPQQQAYVPAPARTPARANWLFQGEDQRFLNSLPPTHDGLVRLDLVQ